VSGSEGHLLALLPALRERGIDARVLGLDVQGTDAPRFYEELDRLGVPHRSVRCGLDVSPRLARDVIRAVRAECPDLLHTHLVHGDVYGSIAAGATGTPFVSTRHNDDRYLLGPFRYVDRGFARRAGRLIAISDAVREFLARAGHDPRKLTTIHYGLDELPAAPSSPTPAEAGIPADAPLALAVGRLIEQKDHATLLRAFALVREQHPEARLAILGGGPLEPETRALAASLGLADAVTLPGRTDIRDWLLRADVFVHTSRWEGFGIVLLEAMLAALPVVATRVSAVPEIVADGVTGALVPPGDAEVVARELAALLADPDRRHRLGEAGRERARTEFSVARMTERTVEVYEASA
jgi:glycosyltransferase involved in cell wall biosynthesis